MRDIRFRAWDKKEAEMINWDWFIGKDQFNLGTLRDLFEPDLIPMQYTGLKDKNGTEIYEGDIIRTCDWNYDEVITGFVKFNEGEWQLWHSETQENKRPSDGALHLFIASVQDDELEVIGNIYENRELLDEN